MNDKERLAQNLKYYRKRLGLTQSELAKKMNYSRSSIAGIEVGKCEMPYSRIVELANALECQPADLVGWEGSNSSELLIGATPRCEMLSDIHSTNISTMEAILVLP